MEDKTANTAAVAIIGTGVVVVSGAVAFGTYSAHKARKANAEFVEKISKGVDEVTGSLSDIRNWLQDHSVDGDSKKVTKKETTEEK